MIIDAHSHFSNIHPPLGQFFTPFPAERLISTMDEYGIDKTIVQSALISMWFDYKQGNKEMIDAINKYPDRLMGFVLLNPRYSDNAVNDLEEAMQCPGIKGIKIHPSRPIPYSLLDYRLEPVMEKAIQYDLPVLTHSSGDMWAPGVGTASPEAVAAFAKKYPQATIIMGHMGWSDPAGAINAAIANKNIILEVSSQTTFGIIEKAVEKIGAERIIFGTEVPICHPVVALTMVKSAKIKESEKELILCGNIKRICKL